MKCPNCDGVGAKQYEDGLWCICPACNGNDSLLQADGSPTYTELGIASAHDAERQELRRRIIEQDATIARQAAQLVQYASMLDAERTAVLVLRDNIVELRTALDAVPLQEIFRCTTNDDYMPEQYDADLAAIDAWLRKELSAE